ncbi:hypothetical protein ATANTOWER_003609 [Ataeniobius toweri]|uniref:Uncharacterized protein n=1 Tax=Ataeniobius toweri TaxID=208326 RepID=A0ABU7AWW1_9TELE|nr:hypothetical protein [Ataeniobius toweri]
MRTWPAFTERLSKKKTFPSCTVGSLFSSLETIGVARRDRRVIVSVEAQRKVASNWSSAAFLSSSLSSRLQSFVTSRRVTIVTHKSNVVVAVSLRSPLRSDRGD